MKQDLTELVFILDRSGSMSGLEDDTIGGMNSFLNKQKQEEGQALVTTVLFDHESVLLHDRIDIRAVAPMTDRDYYVRGSTALLDAIGTTIEKISTAHAHTAEDYRPAHVLFVITTDGYENDSRRYTLEAVRAMITDRKAQGWEFVFLGANIDAVRTAASFGIGADRAANYHADSIGTRKNFDAVSDAATAFRKSAPCAPLSADWKQSIDKDFHSRKKNR